MTVLAIIDLDGTIADDRHRIPFIDHEANTLTDKYHEYHSRCYADPVINRDIVDDHVAEGHKIIFNTSRPEEFRNPTCAWLTMNFKLPEDTLLVMRPNGNHESSHVLKPKAIRQYIFGHEHVIAYDDKPAVCDAYLFVGVNKHVCIGPMPQAIQTDSVPQLLRQAAETFEERNKAYGDAYKNGGKVMHQLFPNGLTLNTEEEWIRFGVFTMIVSKMTRYAANMKSGGHKDSAHDLAVYAAMLEEMTK